MFLKYKTLVLHYTSILYCTKHKTAELAAAVQKPPKTAIFSQNSLFILNSSLQLWMPKTNQIAAEKLVYLYRDKIILSGRDSCHFTPQTTGNLYLGLSSTMIFFSQIRFGNPILISDDSAFQSVCPPIVQL